MIFTKPDVYCLLLSSLFFIVKGGSLPLPDFESGWLPIKNGLEHVARLNIDHGLGEIPVLVDVSVKIGDHIFPASGFRPDHPKERSGPVVYIYDDMYVNVSTSPIEDPLYRIFPKVPRQYEGELLIIYGDADVRIRAWQHSSVPVEDFKQTRIILKANTSKVSDSYAEVNHNLNELPCLVVVRMKMQHGDGTITADGVAIFDGRKHTWFDMVISEGEAEIYAWKCSTITPQYNQRVVTKNTLDEVPSLWNLNVDYDLEPSLIRVSVLAEQPGGANEGFRFPGGMYLGLPAASEAGNSLQHTTVGGLSYTYKTKYKFNFLQPKRFDNESTVFIAESFGYGTNSETSNSESIYIQSFIYEDNNGCPTPVLPNGFTNMSINGTSTGANTTVQCNDGFVMKPNKDYYIHDYERDTITCSVYGYWENIPKCMPKDKEVGNECNPAVDKCRDIHASCTLIPENSVYKCACNDGYRHRDRLCKAMGKYLPKADYDSDWITLNRNGRQWYRELEHGLDTAPVLVDVQVEVNGYIFHAIGFPPSEDDSSLDTSAVVYIYDDSYINVSSFLPTGDWNDDLILRSTYMWYGYQYTFGGFRTVRARAWKAESLPTPDVSDDTKVLRVNNSTASDSFYELEHNLGEYPGLVVVRAKMMYNGSTFYANGVGSALNVFYNTAGLTNAFLVHGFNDRSVRMWIDSSVNGAIFDGRKMTKYDMIISEAKVEIFAWKLSTLTPFFTYKFSLEEDRFPYSVEFTLNYKIKDALNVAVAQISDSGSPNQGYRFPSSSYLADRDGYHHDNRSTRCIFGGFMYGYGTGPSMFFSNLEADIKMLLFKPKNYTFPYHDTGALTCIPESFGDGKYTDAAFSGIGVLYSWINGDCGPPPQATNGFLNTTINGTEVGAEAFLECNEGYLMSYNELPICRGDVTWQLYNDCRPVACETVEAPVNGTMNVSGLTYGHNTTFQCDTGYILNGTEVIECLSTGNWSANTPFCSLLVHTEYDNKFSRSEIIGVSVIHILLAVSTYMVVFIENT